MRKTDGRRLFIDHSHTTISGYRTGVQRVVRSICKNATLVDGPFSDIQPVARSTNGFRVQQPDAQPPLPGSWTHRLRRICLRQKDAYVLPSLGPNDVLLMPDAYWAFPSIWPTIERLRARGVRTAVLIYDLIPHTHSEIYGEEGAAGFREYIRLACKNADCLVAISETVRQQLNEHLPNILGARFPFPVGSFRLGADFESTTGRVREDLKSFMSDAGKTKPYLMVGTIEARKNHAFALDALDMIWARGIDARLCIVGQSGWRGEAFLQRLVNHPQYGKSIQWFQHATDAEVAFCYQQARAVLFPSLTEGFGLPIVESLWYGRPTFASDIPIHREVGKKHCQYFELSSPTHLHDLLAKFECENRKTNQILACQAGTRGDPQNALWTWSQSVADLFSTLDRLLPDHNHQRSKLAA